MKLPDPLKPLNLLGSTVGIEHLQHEHYDLLRKVASNEKIWEHIFTKIRSDADLKKFIETRIADRDESRAFPFFLYHAKSREPVGVACFLDVNVDSKNLEIGAVWLDPAVWGTGFMIEMNLLLLTYCFETMGAIRVYYKTDIRNIRSQKAISKFAQYEGTFRNHMIRHDGTYRDSMFYSVILEEWPAVKEKLAR